MDHSIGELALRAGVTVKAVRYYSDLGLLDSWRTTSGHRRYDEDALDRLELIRQLRALGIDVPTVRAVLTGQRTLSEVATAHAEALGVQIRTLQVRQAVLRVVAQRPEEIDQMSDLTPSDESRRALITDFLDAVIGDDPELQGVRQTLTPELPDDATDHQLCAWLDLTVLMQDEAFRETVRQMVADWRTDELRPDVVSTLRQRVAPALAAALDPASPEARVLIAEITAEYAARVGRPADDQLRIRLSKLLGTAGDPRWHRYLRLLAAVNGWDDPEPLQPIYDWTRAALEHVG
ncbi:MerR family transcriptional regulator [Kribbella antibiotica]|uniref:MerR family transcriptional regulator n=1 Tax=Kribbella antibiotica TaxID=190195 RepID=A0A4R4ZJH2_9ACTN|nr:MerR family transcriptional regulator [Kribbella antibiotica]TDD58196.1 MerR family transcriptional regulator [Kribbella antibiotica]